MTTDLSVLIPLYAHNKQEQDRYKKLCDKQNTEIKSAMTKAELSTFEVDGYTASLSVSKRENIIEDKLIELLKENKIRGIVKKKEYIDMDALEKALYAGKIPAELVASMDNCKTYKEISTLRVTKIKKKTED